MLPAVVNMNSSCHSRPLSVNPEAVATRLRRAEETREQEETRLAKARERYYAKKTRNEKPAKDNAESCSLNRRQNETLAAPRKLDVGRIRDASTGVLIETLQQRKKRLDKERRRSATRRKNETSDQRKVRLDADRDRARRCRAEESNEHRNYLLDSVLDRYFKRRREETYDQHQCRLKANRKRVEKHRDEMRTEKRQNSTSDIKKVIVTDIVK